MNEKELSEKGYRKYGGTDVDVFFNTTICEHAGNCVRGNPDIFDTKRRPWILPDNDSVDEVIRVIDTCPSGALKYIKNRKENTL